MGKAGSAFSASAGEHFTAATGLHTFSKTMLLFALELFGLIGSKQCLNPLSGLSFAEIYYIV